MIRLMKKTSTKNGDIVTPFLIESDIVYCYNGTKKTIIKKLDDFNTIPILPKNIVTPEIYQTDQLFKEEEEKALVPTIEPSSSVPETISKPIKKQSKINIYEEEDYI